MASESEEEDEDYNPQDDADMADSKEDEDALHDDDRDDSNHTLSAIQLQCVDDAFERLFGYKWGTAFQFATDRELESHEKILCQMLGPVGAARVLRTRNRSSGFSKVTTTATRKGKTVHKKKQHTTKHLTHREPKLETVPISETSKGSMPVTEQSNPLVVASQKDGSAAAAPPPPAAVAAAPPPPAAAAGVGKLLETLSSSGKVSTVAKTSGDWDKFKEQTGLGEKLEEQAESNTAFLKRQDFLERVDHRKFELEKQERERDRLLRK